jgi:hypothetical protein
VRTLKIAIAVACLLPATVLATPIMLECAISYPVAERTYQIIFDAAARTVAVDDKKPVKANITETLITWTEVSYTEHGRRDVTAWTVNRLTGAWRVIFWSDSNYARAQGGQCTAPPPRKF